jgi:hypothetical protein
MGKIILRLTVPTQADLARMTRRPIQATADHAVSLIKLRTARGQSSGGGPFKPYSPSYRLQRIASGRKGEPVDLTITGQMLGSLKRLRTESNTSAVVGFEGQHRNTRFRATSKRGFVSDRATKRTVGRGTFAKTFRQKLGRGVSGPRRQGTFGTLPYAVLVPALNHTRPFFAVTRREELSQLVATFQRTFDDEIRRYNSTGKR